MKVSATLAAVLCHGVTAVKPVVNLGYSIFQGTELENGLTQWLGMPYAAPPVGDLRWRAPQDPASTQGIQAAVKQSPSCLGTGEDPLNPAKSEDCLYAAVYAPTNATSCRPLPVFVWIMGGGFNQNSGPNTNGTGIITASNGNMVVVTFNYRVGNYGFLTTGDTEADTNMGLLDQRKLLHWVKTNIRKFGGDPNHVVIGGASAGAASVTYHLTAYDGQDQGLFHGAAAESQSFGTVRTSLRSRYQYVNVAKLLGCWEGSNADEETPSDADTAVLECMRSAPATKVQQATATNIPYPDTNATKGPLYMWNPSIDGKIIKGLTIDRFREQKYVQVPTIFGDDQNEGTNFAPRSAATLQQSNDFLIQNYPSITAEQLSEFDELYPNQNLTCPNAGCYWRRTADVYGDIRYLCPGLFLGKELSPPNAEEDAPGVWIYRYNVVDPEQEAQGVGVPHTVENNAVFGPQYMPNPAPKSYLPGGINQDITRVVQGYWSSFITNLDPNVKRAEGTSEWERWVNVAGGSVEEGYEKGRRLLFSTGGGSEMEDVGQEQAVKCAYAESVAIALEQ